MVGGFSKYVLYTDLNGTFYKMLDALAHEGESSTVMLQEKCAFFSAITENKQNILVFKTKEPNGEGGQMS